MIQHFMPDFMKIHWENTIMHITNGMEVHFDLTKKKRLWSEYLSGQKINDTTQI